MAKRKNPSQIIGYWAPRLGLDPRAVKVVAGGEGGLKWGAVGDGGHAFGPFQMNDAGGVLTGRFGSSQARAAFANSEQGMVEAMRAMAKAGARGQTGLAAVSTIISKYERPANIPASIEKARQRWRDWGMGSVPPTNPRHAGGAEQSMPSSPVFGLDASTSGIDAQRRAAAEFFRSRAMARISNAPVPGIGGLAATLRSIRNENAAVDLAPQPPEGEIQSPSRPRGTQVAPSPGTPGMPGVIQAGEYARKLGLSVRENPYYDPVDPVHTEGSDHYRTVGTYRGRPYGAALDVSGDPAKKQRFFRWLEANARRLKLDDMFHDPLKMSWDEGRRIPGRNLAPGHDHVHASFL